MKALALIALTILSGVASAADTITAKQSQLLDRFAEASHRARIDQIAASLDAMKRVPRRLETGPLTAFDRPYFLPFRESASWSNDHNPFAGDARLVSVTIIQKISDSTAIVDGPWSHAKVWLVDPRLKGVVDDQDHQLDGLYWMSGKSKSYTTAIGSQATLAVLEPLVLTRDQAKRFELAAYVETFRDDRGKAVGEGVPIRRRGAVVDLLQPDGELTRLRLAKLNDVGRQRIDALLPDKTKAELLPGPARGGRATD